MNLINIKFDLQLQDSADNEKFAPIVEQAMYDFFKECRNTEIEFDASPTRCLADNKEDAEIELANDAGRFITPEMGENAIAVVHIRNWPSKD